jgi:hypothetical protein
VGSVAQILLSVNSKGGNMFTPLVPIKIDSIYGGPLPQRLAKCTPDMYAAIFALKQQLQSVAADLVLSDLFRSYEMQLQAHSDFVTKKKSAYSPPPGGSMHEAGRGGHAEKRTDSVGGAARECDSQCSLNSAWVPRTRKAVTPNSIP